MSNSVYSDFCQAWMARFPGSQLPAAWEEDVRANLKKHKAKVAVLREEIEKEEMYVEYLDKLLVDIERHRKGQDQDDELISQQQEPDVDNSKKEDRLNGENKQFLEDQMEQYRTLERDQDQSRPLSKPSLKLDLDQESSFVTVINVPSPNGKDQRKSLATSTTSDSKKSKSEALLRKVPPRPPPKRASVGSRDSLNSVSSPTTPTSFNEDLLTSPREGIARDPTLQASLSSSSEETLDEAEAFDPRGRPDGRDNEDKTGATAPATAVPDRVQPKVSKIRELMANWENKSPIQMKTRTSAEAKRKDSDSSSRGRMGSPSGKSHDSSDSETSLSRQSGSEPSPGARRKLPSGETRLDRLVRRPSGERTRHSEALPAPALPLAQKKPKAKPRSIDNNKKDEPLYDTVANDEPEDEYDNHLLYGTANSNKSNGTRSSSTDLGFDEPVQVGTLSSTEGFSAASPSLQRSQSLEEEETNYVNIQYFLQKNHIQHVPEADPSDDESGPGDRVTASSSASSSREDLLDSTKAQKSDAEQLVMCKCILNSIVESEAVYLEGLNVMVQYMNAMKMTFNTSQPVIPKPDFDTIFFKIPDLHELHRTFYESLKKQVERWSGSESVGHTFKMLASRTKVYAAFLNNYHKALETLHRCNESHPQFADLTRSIKLRTVKGQRQAQSMSLEDLLHKPVARVQKHSLCLQDLIKYIPETHKDHVTLNEALNQVQTFLNEYNMMHADELFPHQERQQRHLVKDSFIVELSEGSRKLRHLFLFNDVLVCAKYKASRQKSEKFTFQLKWYIPLWNALIVEEPSSEPKETSTVNLVGLKTQAAALRDQIHRIVKEEEWKGVRRSSGSSSQSASTGSGGAAAAASSKSTEKLRNKLAEVGGQIVVASPTFLFQVTHKTTGKAYSFLLSSEYEKAQWVETLQVLQSSLPTTTAQKNMSMEDLQAWISSCRKFLVTNMGSFLMKSTRDADLLVGDLHFSVNRLQGLTRPANLFVVLEVDSYGHFFRKFKSSVSNGTLEPSWNEEAIIELEGSENLRILVYEQQAHGPVLQGRATLELSRSWLTKQTTEQRISMNDLVLICGMKYVTFEETIQRVPQTKTSGLFGTSIQVSARREKRAVPFIITSCVREVERRGINEVGIYRVSGSAAEVARLKRAYESNAYEAEQLLKECDIHSVASTLKLFLRDLPESLFTAAIYRRMLEAYHLPDPDQRHQQYLSLFSQIPQSPNQACVVFLIEHMVRIANLEAQNKMSLHNLATVFGPTLLHGGTEKDKKAAKGEMQQLTTGTVDVMAQAGILHFFISRRARGEPIQIVERQV